MIEIEDILSQIDILEYVSQYCEDIREKNGEWWCLSPLNNEKTPSFSINTEKQKFYDFSSGIGGNVIDFVKAYHHCDFVNAIRILKQYANIPDTPYNSPTTNRLQSTSIAKRFRKPNQKNRESTAQILPDDYMERYEFAPQKMEPWLNEGISLSAIEKFSVRYDPFSNRIVFPLRNYNGKIINVCGRTLDEDYKAKGLRKYTYFMELGSLDTMYGFFENKAAIEKKREIILFEGAKSVLKADGWGINNACAILTSHLNPNQFAFLVKLGVRVVFALDEEIDVRKDVHIEKLKRYVKVEWVKNYDHLLLEKMAPVDAGFAVWQELYGNRVALN